MQAPDLQPDTGAAATRCTLSALALAIALTLAAPLAAQAAEALREVRDPVTGEMRGPTAAEAAAYERAAAQLRQKSGKSAAPVEIAYPDGTVETKLGDDTVMYSVVRTTEDGGLAMACLPASQVSAFHRAAGKPAKSSDKNVAAKAKAKVNHAHP